MATLNKRERRKEMASAHAKRKHICQFCGAEIYGNGGYAAHMRKEYFQRMPDMKSVKWVTVVELRHEWRRRNPTMLAPDDGDSFAETELSNDELDSDYQLWSSM